MFYNLCSRICVFHSMICYHWVVFYNLCSSFSDMLYYILLSVPYVLFFPFYIYVCTFSYDLCSRVSAGEVPDTPSSFSPPASADNGAGVRSRHCRVRSITSKSEMVPPWASSGNVLPEVSLPVLMTHQPTSPPSAPHPHQLPFTSGFARLYTSPHYPPLLATITSAENITETDGGTAEGAGGGGGGGGEVTESGGGETEMGVSKEGEEEEEEEVEDEEGKSAHAGSIKLLPISVPVNWPAQGCEPFVHPSEGHYRTLPCLFRYHRPIYRQ